MDFNYFELWLRFLSEKEENWRTSPIDQSFLETRTLN